MSEFIPGFETREKAIRAGKKAFARTNGMLGIKDRDFHVAQNEHGRWHFVEGRPKRPSPAQASGSRKTETDRE